jgi:hypothetical protein
MTCWRLEAQLLGHRSGCVCGHQLLLLPGSRDAGRREQRGPVRALLRYAEARYDGAVISAWAQIALANSSKATANRRFAGS